MKNPLLPLLLLLAACAGGPETSTEGPVRDEAKGREIAERIKARQEAELTTDLIQLDQAVDKYIQARNALPNDRAMRLVVQLDGVIRTIVHRNFDALRARAVDARDPGNRSIALFALGFADHGDEVRKARAKLRDKLMARGVPRKEIPPELPDRGDQIEAALQPLLAALHDAETRVRAHALLGIGTLRSPTTPLAPITNMLEDDRQPLDVARNAAWTLLQLQDVLPPQQRTPIRMAYLRVLSRDLGDVQPEIASQLLWAVAQFRQQSDAEIVRRYTKHPAPLIRMNAALGLGLMRDEKTVPDLIELIRPEETNPNVRLTARKALMAMAGGLDRKYDVAAWKALFERK